MESKHPRKVYRRFLLELQEVPALERSQALALGDYLQDRLELIETLYGKLGNPRLKTASPEELMVVGCYLEDLYSAFYSLFLQISHDFRRLVPVTRKSVLERMRMDLNPVRPAVIDGAAFEKLLALARFRHKFRETCGSPLDARDLEPALRKALELRAIYRPQLEAFGEFLRRMG